MKNFKRIKYSCELKRNVKLVRHKGIVKQCKEFNLLGYNDEMRTDIEFHKILKNKIIGKGEDYNNKDDYFINI